MAKVGWRRLRPLGTSRLRIGGQTFRGIILPSRLPLIQCAAVFKMAAEFDSGHMKMIDPCAPEITTQTALEIFVYKLIVPANWGNAAPQGEIQGIKCPQI
jgi:hypothetical protein